jgi:hypothetical protein
MAINLGDAFSYLDQDIPPGGINSFELPAEKPFIPGYNEEMNIDDSNKIRIRDYLKEFGNTAQGGLTKITDQGMSLFDDNRRSNLIRAGLGSILFGFNPLTAILGAVIGQKGPGIVSNFRQGKFNPFKFVQDQKDKREAAAKAEFDRLNAIRQQRDADSMSGGPGETTQGTFGSSVNDPSTFSDYS